MKPFLVIMGMHRSGTSFLARALNLCGVYLGNQEEFISNEFNPAKDNPRGHWENKIILNLTNKSLLVNDGSWHTVPTRIIVSKDLGEEIKKSVENITKYPSFAAGFKDPRMCVLLESWIPFLPKNLILVGIFRNPLKVAESLKKRDGFDYETSLNLWEIYNRNLLGLLNKHVGFLLDFDSSKEKLLSDVYLILDKLGLPKIDLSNWFAEELKQADKTYSTDYSLRENISSLYSKLKDQSSKNAEVRIPKTDYNITELHQIISGLLLEIKHQSDYFRINYDRNLSEIPRLQYSLNQAREEIKKLQKINEEQQNTISAILNSKTWRILRTYDKIITRILKTRN